ncbi:MAG: 6-hydroxymethylpterin diphosphokinase MptE-like protein, partial [Campylobacterota bacterium]|nr:6-hydroxymethylpterin diphosphokinase MptE-like protein [Campylobacterota bacterium]
MKEDITKQTINNFSNNLIFLKNKDINLYNRVEVLTQLINENKYETQYELEYIKDDKNFDIFHKRTNSYIYNKKPSLFIKNAIETINKNKINTIDLLNIKVFNQRNPFIKDKNLPFHTRLRVNLINEMFEYIKILKAPTNYKNKKFKYIDKFIFIGTLLGTHIKDIDNKLKAKLYFIYENNLEIFRLSLFTIDYSLLSKNSKLIFSIMDDKIDIQKKLTNYFSYNKESNYMIKYYSTNYNIGDFFDRILSVSAVENPFNYDYQRILNDLIKNSMKKISSSKILNTQNNSNNILKDKKILFLAAGPSLERNIKWIKENKNKFIIIAVAATLKTILKHKIIPHIITSADSHEIVIKQFPKEYKNIFNKIPFLASISTDKKVLRLFNKKNIFFYEIGTHFKNNSQELSAYTIGEITLQLISILGANKIYMLGSDMALDQETGSTHISNHKFNKSYNLDKIAKSSNSFIKNENFDLHESTLKVKGNFQEQVITTSRMSKSIEMYNIAINKILSQDNSKKIYNLNNGAYFEGAIPTKIENINISQFDNINLSNNLIIESLKKLSKLGFTNNEINNLKDSIII